MRFFILAAATFVASAGFAGPARAAEPATATLRAVERPAANASASYTLDELIDLALNRNENIGRARADLEYIMGQRTEAYAAAYPRADWLTFAGGPVPEAIGDVNSVTTNSQFGNFKFGNVGLLVRTEFNAVWPLYTFGKIGYAEQAAEAGVLAAGANIDRVRAETARDIYKVYWGLVLAREVLKVIDEGEKQIAEAIQKLNELLAAENAEVTLADTYRLNYFAAQVKNRRVQARQMEETALTIIKLLAGMNQDELPQIVPRPLPGNEAPAAVTLAEAQTAAAINRPELKLTLHAETARRNWYYSKSKAYWPDFFVAGEIKYSWSNAATDQVNPFVRDDYNYAEGGIGLGMRVGLDIGTKIAEERQAHAEWSKSEYERQFAERGVRLEVTKAHRDYAFARERLAALDEAEKYARQWLTAETMNFSLGIAETRSLLEGLLAAYETRTSRLEALFNLQAAQADLAYATGNLSSLSPAAEKHAPTQ